MTTDILLDEAVLTLKAPQVRLEGHDLEIRDPARKGPGKDDEYRRALVHGEQDQLVVNFRSDYDRTELHGGLEMRDVGKPALLTMYASNAKVLRAALGDLRLARDLLLPIDGRKVADVSQLDANRDSLSHTLRWFDARLDAIETRLATIEHRLQLPTHPIPPRP